MAKHKQPSPLKGRKLTPEQIESRRLKTLATRAAKHGVPVPADGSSRAQLSAPADISVRRIARPAHWRQDAMTYLRHAEAKVYERLRKGQLRSLDESHMLMILALRTLESELLAPEGAHD